jgi:erythronate-4-phosphate dehydrogenase
MVHVVVILVDKQIPYAEACFASIGTVETYSDTGPTTDQIRRSGALVVRATTSVNAGLLNGSPVQFVASPTSGTDHIDNSYLDSRGIGFASAPGGNSNAVAEYTIAAILHLATKYNLDLRETSLGIIGVGHIGSKVARKAEAIGLQVRLNDPPLQRTTGDARYRPISEIFECDFITLHTPLTRDGIDKTYHLVDRHFLGSLKRGAFLINTSRGEVVDTHALKHALRKGDLGGVVLDVWENEPDIDPELVELVDNATPHIAGYTHDGRLASVITVYKAICQYFGMEPANKLEDFQNEHGKNSLAIDPTTAKPVQLLNQVVQEAYSLEKDDIRVHRLESLSTEERVSLFRKLRSEYPVRREFSNWRVELAPYDEHTAKQLSGLGFRVIGYN